MSRWATAIGAGCLAGFIACAWTIGLDEGAGDRAPIDMVGYDEAGEAVIHRVGARSAIVSYRMPMATMLAAGIRFHSGLSAPSVRALYQSVVVVLVFALACLLHPLGALFSGLAVYALFSGAFTFAFYPESGYTPFVLLAACALVWRARSPSPGRSALLALAVGASLLYRSPLVFFPPLLALYEWGAYHRFSLKSYWKHLLILCVVPYLPLLPWIALNGTIYGQFVPFEQGAANSNIVTGALGLVRSIEGDLRTLVGPSVDVESTGDVLGWAAREVLGNPLRYALAIGRRAVYALSLDPYAAFFAVCGVWAFRRRREYQQLGLLAGYFLAIHCLMSVEENYFWPLWPLAAVLAASLAACLWTREEPGPASFDYRFAVLVTKSALAAALAAAVGVGATVGSYAAWLRRGRAPAEADLSRELARHPNDVWLLLERGRDRLSRGQAVGAAEDFASAARQEPLVASHRLKEAGARLTLGQPRMILRLQAPKGTTQKELMLRYDGDILKACAHIMLGRTKEAEALLKTASEVYMARNALVNGRQGVLERDVLAKLRTSDTGFVRRCLELQGDRPPAERRALIQILTKLLPESDEARRALTPRR